MAGEARFGKSNTQDFLNLAVLTSQIVLGEGTKTASATTGAATLHQPSGVITTESLTTAAAGTYTLTITNNKVKATDIVQATVSNPAASAGAPVLISATPADGSLVVVIKNVHASAAFNNTLAVMFSIIKA
jgi:hypothetical protein